MRVAALLSTLFAAFVLAGAPSWQPASAQGDTIQKKFADLYQSAMKEGEVIYYTDGRQDEAQRLSDYWKANFPGVNLRIVPKSSPALIAQIETERAAGQHRVDVSHMSQPTVAALWKQKGFYQAYKTASFERLRPDNADADGAFSTPDVYVLPAAYNTNVFRNKAELPRSLKDFLDPRWKGKLVLADPEVSGNTLTFLMTMLATGALDWGTLAGLAKQDILFVRSNPDSVRMVASGERALSPMISSFNIMTARLKGQPIDYYVLSDAIDARADERRPAPQRRQAPGRGPDQPAGRKRAVARRRVLAGASGRAAGRHAARARRPPSGFRSPALACRRRQYPGLPAAIQNGVRPSMSAGARRRQPGP
jgi:iron(III) transport system substrate-binding protein